MFERFAVSTALGAALLRAFEEYRRGLLAVFPLEGETVEIPASCLDEAIAENDRIRVGLVAACELGRAPVDLVELLAPCLEQFGIGLRTMANEPASREPRLAS